LKKSTAAVGKQKNINENSSSFAPVGFGCAEVLYLKNGDILGNSSVT